MPLYEYRCSQCEKTFEVMQKFSDAPLEKCDACGGSVSKIISRTSFQLKGSGWYASDYKKSASPSTSTESPTSSSPTKSGCGSGGGSCSN